MLTVSTLTCPLCATATVETMPVNACIYFHDCGVCGAVIRPKRGDCCVFCSYGDTPCPAKQEGAERCAPEPKGRAV